MVKLFDRREPTPSHGIPFPRPIPKERNKLVRRCKGTRVQFWKYASANCSFIGAWRGKIARTLQGLIMQRIASLTTLIGVGLSESAAVAVLVAPVALQILNVGTPC